MRFIDTLQEVGLGTPTHNGIVIAWGYMNDELLAVIILLNEGDRIPNEVNYIVCQMDLDGNIIDQQTYPNIVPTVDAYVTDYGMDY